MKLILEDIEKSFAKKHVLKGASFTFETGLIYGLIGRNGAGKTTLFNCINEDLKMDAGKIRVETEGRCAIQDRKILDMYSQHRLSRNFLPDMSF